MAGGEQVPLQKILRMKSGVGETSYSRNSSIQKVIASLTKSTRTNLARDFYQANLPEKIVMADLGCSSGPNATLLASDAIRAVLATCKDLDHPPPEFQIFLNDLPWNDFNSTFRSLEDFYLSSGGDTEGQLCFVLGAPGSFYGRLFPSRSLHYVVSSSSLHWLSEVPQVLQEGSVLNEGRVFISKTSHPSVFDAYKNQFQAGFSIFLKYRGIEMVKGGVMVLTFMGRRGSDPSAENVNYMWELLAIALMDLASMGLIEEEKVDTFNAPYYPPSMDEVEQEITMEGSFVIRKIELFEASYDALLENQYRGEEKHDETPKMFNGTSTYGNQFLHLKALHYAELTTKTNRAVLESMIRNHFGGEIMEELWRRYRELLEEYYCRNKAELTNMLVALERK